MATRNLFRFVSVRPPTATEVEQECALANPQSARVLVKAVLTRQREQHESLADARRGVAVEFMKSENYFTHSDAWAEVRPLRTEFRTLIESTCRPEREDEDEVVEREDQEALEGAEVSASFAVQARDWVLDLGAFRMAKRVLWQSYYANVLAPDMRPNDRAELDDWIHIVDALERLNPSADSRPWKFSEGACTCIGRLRRARVHLPGEVFVEEQVPDKAPEKPADEADEYKEKYRARLTRLTAARAAVDDVWQRKVRVLRLQNLTNTNGVTGNEDSETRADRQDTEPNANQPVLAPQAPWLFTAQDAEDYSELATELDELGLTLPGSLVSEVADALDASIAADTSALLELESRNDFFGVGAAMTIARRAHRGFRPDLQDRDHVAPALVEMPSEPQVADELREDE